MPCGKELGKSAKRKSQDMNWKDFADLLCVAEPRWEDEPKKVWYYFTCRKYVKMTLLSKMLPLDCVEVQVRRWEGQMPTCTSRHFVL